MRTYGLAQGTLLEIKKRGCFRFGCLEKLFGYTYIYSFLYYFPLWLIIGH